MEKKSGHRMDPKFSSSQLQTQSFSHRRTDCQLFALGHTTTDLLSTEINKNAMPGANSDKAAMGEGGSDQEAMMETEDETNKQSVLSLDRPSLWTEWELRRQRLRPGY